MQECLKAPKILTSPKQLYSKLLNLSTEVPHTSRVRTCKIQQDRHISTHIEASFNQDNEP